jgi:hypothetical protein
MVTEEEYEMGHLDEVFFSAFEEKLSLPELGLRLILKQFDDAGITLTDSQVNKLREDLQSKDIDELHVDLNDEQEQLLRATQGEAATTLELDFDKLKDLPQRLDQVIMQAVPEFVQGCSQLLLKSWKSQAREILEEQRQEHLQFREKVSESWGHPIDLLEMLISVCMEEGASFNDAFREEALRNNDFAFEALTRIHARSCQVAFEILTLLKNGFADGAHARWRTLHELTVVAMFIGEHGQAVAKRYLEHRVVTTYKSAQNYQRHCNTLGYSPLDSQEMQQLESGYQDAIDRHGREFGRDYGWAASVLRNPSPTFVDIERSVSLEHFRPFCKLANMNVHAGSRGVVFRIGMPPRDNSLLLAGSSLFGLAYPGQNTAASICKSTATLLLTRPNMDRLSFVCATQSLVQEIFEAFVEACRQLEDAG